MLYGLECFQLGKADRHSLDFTFNRLSINLYSSRNGNNTKAQKTNITTNETKAAESKLIDVVKDCQSYFAIDLPSCLLKRRRDQGKFPVIVVLYVATSLVNKVSK